MCTGETPAKPVGDAGLLAPSGEERQFRAVAAHAILSEVFGLPADIVDGSFHDGDPFRGSRFLTDQRIPAVVKLPVDFRAEQCRVFCPFTRAPDAVAADTHALELVAGRVKDVVADIDFFVSHHLSGFKINERCGHKKKMMMKINYCIYRIIVFLPENNAFA